MSCCRFCHEEPGRFDLIQYGVRHYAHPDCGLRALGTAFFDRLSDWQVEQFPYFAAREAGCDAELERRIAAIASGKDPAP